MKKTILLPFVIGAAFMLFTGCTKTEVTRTTEVTPSVVEKQIIVERAVPPTRIIEVR